jgi:hypothetical protein
MNTKILLLAAACLVSACSSGADIAFKADEYLRTLDRETVHGRAGAATAGTRLALPSLLQDLIFKPLGMTASGYGVNSRELPRLASGYQPHGARNSIADPVDTSWLYAAGFSARV